MVIAAIGATLIGITERSLPAGFAGIFFLIVGFASTAPALTVVLTAALRPFLRKLAGVLGAIIFVVAASARGDAFCWILE